MQENSTYDNDPSAPGVSLTMGGHKLWITDTIIVKEQNDFARCMGNSAILRGWRSLVRLREPPESARRAKRPQKLLSAVGTPIGNHNNLIFTCGTTLHCQARQAPFERVSAVKRWDDY
jgi:hypothetical protein